MPWCHTLDARIDRLKEEYGDAVSFEWRAYLLRPVEKKGRDLDKFRHYTKNWLRIAQEEDAAEYNAWQGEEGPPSHSIPPHMAAKAAQDIDPAAFERLHRALMRAYFIESRDITSEANLRELWVEAGLAAEDFTRAQDPALEARVIAEHKEALELSVTGVPAMRLADNPAVIVGAHPLSLYRRWIDRSLARAEEGEGVAEGVAKGGAEA